MFPGIRYRGVPMTFEEVDNCVSSIRISHVDDATAVLVDMLFDDMTVAGYDFSEEGKFDKDIAVVVEGIRSLLSKHYAIAHPFQQLAEKIIDRTEEGDVRLVIDENAPLEEGMGGSPNDTAGLQPDRPLDRGREHPRKRRHDSRGGNGQAHDTESDPVKPGKV